MRIGTTANPAAAAARAEVERWRVVIEGGWSVTERAVVVYFDPAEDLERRARSWNHRLEGHGLSDLALFGAGLAAAEADAWEQDEPHVATRALEDRRFLLGDRLLHWAVPWLAEQPGDQSRRAMVTLLELGEEHRPAPLLAGNEGLFAPGEDSYGPADRRPLDSVWCGAVIPPGVDAAQCRARAQSRWEALCSAYPGSARFWHDLSLRCR